MGKRPRLLARRGRREPTLFVAAETTCGAGVADVNGSPRSFSSMGLSQPSRRDGTSVARGPAFSTAAEEGPAHHALHTVIDPDFVRDHNLRAIPPCHDRMLHIGSRCLGPVGSRPSQRRDDQMYQDRSHLSSSEWNLWVAPYVFAERDRKLDAALERRRGAREAARTAVGSCPTRSLPESSRGPTMADGLGGG